MESISSIFGDCATEITMSENIEDEEEESDKWLGDWERLMDDEELFELTVENISMSLLDMTHRMSPLITQWTLRISH